jgi:hypothetical protein
MGVIRISIDGIPVFVRLAAFFGFFRVAVSRPNALTLRRPILPLAVRCLANARRHQDVLEGVQLTLGLLH